MGHVTCGLHPRQRCCWRCDRCPKCERAVGRLRRGDYCAECTAKFRAEGFVWSEYNRDWVAPEDAELNRRFGWSATGQTDRTENADKGE